MKKKIDRLIEFSKSLDQAGFSLIEMMIAGVILSLMITAFLQFTGMQQKALATSETNFDTLDFVNQVRMVLSDPPSCKKTFGDKSISGATVNTIIRTYENPSTHEWSDQDFITVGKTIGTTLQVTSIEVKGSDPFDGMGSVTFKIKRVKNGVMGGTEISRNVPIYIKPNPTDPNLIDECYAWGSASGGPAAFCAAMGTTFDATTGKCKDVASEIINPEIATCGSGSRVQLVSADGKIKVQCTPCTRQEVFDHYECQQGDNKGWYNMCFYKTVCAEDPTAVIVPVGSVGIRGDSSASKDDAGSHKNCVEKRYKCGGEP